MSITHEAYLFKPSEFADEVLPFTKAMTEDASNERQLDEKVIRLYEDNPRVSRLAIEYGGWDGQSLYDAIEHARQSGRTNVSLWLIFMIYGHTSLQPGELGLGLWWLIEKVLAALHWHPSDIADLVHGHSFGYFAQLMIIDKIEIMPDQKLDFQYWEAIRPASTGATIGWLGYADVKRLREKLMTEEFWLVEVDWQAWNIPFITHQAIQKEYQAALHMLTIASETQSGLCLITSG